MPAQRPAAGSHGAADQDFRLPRGAEPHRYRLTLAPDLDAARFSGRLELDLTLHERLDEVVLNAAELSIDRAELEVEGRGALAMTVTLDEELERATFTPANAEAPLPTGPAVLRCSFAGVLNDKLRGFYRSTFTDHDGERRVIATTQMEATDARRAFPCFDEPDRKAVFEVTLEVAEGLAAFSNSPVVDERALEGGRRAVRFGPTIKMSTYLVAFVVGPLEATAPRMVEGVAVRVVHVPGKAHLTGHALEVAAHALSYFSSYFDLAYPAEKLDLVAIPDFAFGAMENLGCVTFRESALLVDPDRAARTELERVADVVSHEIAHMWFGDLVTMRWWNGIWLNEAFATFMEVLCVDAYRPAWRRWVSFGLEREAAMAVDGLHTTRPVEYPVAKPEEAEGMFDVLTYQKGGSVLRMLEQYLGAQVFRDGVRAYLRRHAHANTETSDLWEALETVSGEPVRAVMDSWIFQGGYPLVEARDATVTQAPFSYRPGRPGEHSAIGGPWQVPVLARSLRDGGVAHRLLLGDTGASWSDHQLVNAGGWGYYRVAYDSAALAELAGQLGALDTLERANLLADTWALVLAGRSQLADFLSLAAGLGDDEDPSTWSVVAAALGLLDRVAPAPDRQTLAKATVQLLGGCLSALGWERRAEEGERVPTLRALLVRTLGTLGGDDDVRRRAAALFDTTHRQGGPRPDPDLEAAVLEVVADQNRPGDFDAVVEAYRHPATPQDELRHLYALAAFPDVALAQRVFDMALGEVRTQNAHFVIQGLLVNRAVGPVMWERVKQEWSTLNERLPVNTASRMVEGVRMLCRSRELAEDVSSFLTSHPLRSGQRSVTQTLERLEVNVAFGERHRQHLADVLGPLVADAP